MTIASIKHWLGRTSSYFCFAMMAAGVSFASDANAQLPPPIYWLNFDDGDGVPDLTPGGGTMGLWNSPEVPNIVPAGGVTFSATDGIFGGSLNATVNQTYSADPTGYASTDQGAGTAIAFPDQVPDSGTAGDMNKITVTVWYKSTTVPGANTFGRIWGIGPSAGTTTDITSPETFGIDFQNSSSRRRPEVASNGLVHTATAGIGNQVAQNEWAFFALTFDGTSALGNDSTVQSTATGGLSTINGQVYSGSNTASVTRFELPMTTVRGDATASNVGIFEFTDTGKIFLANRTTTGRGFIGFIDDFRIYDYVLTPLQVENVRQQGLVGNTTAPYKPPGDFNGDNKIDAADYVVWRKDPMAHGGDNGYASWRANFGSSAGSGASLASNAVPEPNTCLMTLFVGVVGMLVRRAARVS
jgi:hypothetical protein